jgi:hypothetical protein
MKNFLLLITLMLTLGYCETSAQTPGAALNFDGTNDYVAIINPYTAFSKEITVEWWVNPTANEFLGSGIGQGSEGFDDMTHNVWLMHFDGSGSKLTFYVNDNSIAWRNPAQITIPSGSWHHVAGVASATETKIYLDGVLQATGPGISQNIFVNATSQVHFGKDVRYGAGVRDMDGSIDEVRIWNRALCQAEIQNNMNCELNPNGRSNLVGYYKFNRGTNNSINSTFTSAPDSSGNSRHGTLVNFDLTHATTVSNWISSSGVVTGNSCALFNAPVVTITASGALTGCPGGMVTLNAPTGGGNTYTYQWQLNGNNISGATGSSLTPNTNGNYHVVATVNGCKSTSNTLTLNLVDQTAPSFTSSMSVDFNAVVQNAAGNVEATSPMGAVVIYNYPAISDNCDADPNLTGMPQSGSIFPIGTTTVMFTASDRYGNTMNKTATITVSDMTAPNIAPAPGSDFRILTPLNMNGHVEATSPAGAVVNYATPQYTDRVDPNATVIGTPASGSIFPIGTSIVTFTARDMYGNAATYQYQITVTDETGPSFITPITLITPVDAAGQVAATSADGAVVNYSLPHIQDLTDPSATVTGLPASGSVFPIGTSEITFYAVDRFGNTTSKSAYITVTDQTAPAFVSPMTLLTPANAAGQVEATSPAGAYVEYSMPGISDAVDANPTVIGMPASGSMFPIGTSEVTFIATDRFGNSASSTGNITVSDHTAPNIPPAPGSDFRILTPLNMNGHVEATSPAGAVVNYATPQYTDIADPGSTILGVPASGSTFPIGVTTITFIARDRYGNTAAYQYNVTVTDETAPSIITPMSLLTPVNAAGQVVATSAAGAVVNYKAPVVRDAVDLNPVVIGLPASGSVFPIGTTEVWFTTTDATGNTASYSELITVTMADKDGDGIADGNDLDNDNDGITDASECNRSNFFWSNAPSISGNTATGTIHGIGYTYTSSSPVTSTTAVYDHFRFPASYNVPNANPTIQNTLVTNNTLSFASPMTNPVLVFASIGNSGRSVPIVFSNPVEVLWSENVVQNSTTQITGTEGYAIVRMNGVFSSISFNYQVAETWCNFAFGADFQTCGDTDNDGIADYLDSDSDNDGCPDALEGGMNFLMSQIVNGVLSGGVGSNGIPLVAGNGQTIGTSQAAAANCFCQAGNDLSAPSITAPAAVTMNVPACQSGTVAVSLGTPVTSDNCTVTVSNNAPATFPIGITTVTWTAKDVANNTSTATQTVTITPLTALSVTSTRSISCSGPNSGTITATAAGGRSPYQYQLNSNAFQSGNTFTNLAPGVYSISVKDADNCTAVQNQVALVEPFCLQAQNDSFSNCAGQPIVIQKSTLLGNDANPWNVSIYMDVAQPANGTVVDNGTSITYTPNANYTGVDQFNYTIKKNDGTIAFAGNGHVYEWVPLSGVTWAAARTAAGQRFYNGMQGYLVTVTSQAEMNFVVTKLQGAGWMGASDRAFEGTWRWVTGPEGLLEGGLGLHFSDQFKNTFNNCSASQAPALLGQYANWNAGEPNDCGATLNQFTPTDINRPGEHYAHFIGGNGLWNDYPNDVGTSILGYIAEYGGMEGSVASTGTSTATIKIDNKRVVIAETITPASCANLSDGSINLNISGGTAQYTYNWGGGITTQNRTGVAVGNYTVTVTDAKGCNTNKTIAVNFVDNKPPVVLTKPIIAALNANGQATISPADVNNGSSDNCGIQSMTLDKTTFGCANLSTNQSGVLTAKMTADNQYTAYLSTNDNVQGTLFGTGTDWGTLYTHTTNLVAGQTYYLHVLAEDVGSIEMFIGDFTVTGDFRFANGLQTLSTNAVNWQVSNTGWSGYVAPYDIGLNGISPWGSKALSANAHYIWRTPFNTPGGGDQAYFTTPVIYTGGGTNVLLSVTDVNGNTASANAQVTVVDAIAPSVTCPANIAVIATSPSGATVNYATPTATDNCSATITRTAGPASGSLFQIGLTTITYKAQDPAGNSTSCSFTVNVTGLPPVIVSPGNQTANNATGQCGAPVNFAATETTGIPASTITYSHNPGSFFPVGTTTVTATATNPVGTSVTTFTVTVLDVTAPQFTGAPAPNLNATCNAIPAPPVVTATDNCSTSPVKYFQVPFVSVNTVHHWQADGNMLDLNGANGTAVGTVNYVPGVLGSGAFNFTGNSYVNAGTAGSISGTGEFAVSAWIRTTGTGGMTIIEQRDNDITGQYILKIGTNHNSGQSVPGKVYFLVAGNEGLGEMYSSTSVNDGKWHHVVGERSGTAIRIYIDGQLDATASTGGVVTMNANGLISTTIGADIRNIIFGVGANYFVGAIDGVKVYNTSACPSAFERDRYWITMDPAQNTTVANQNLHIVDTTGPVITCPGNINVTTSGLCGTNVSYVTTATDNCSTPVITYSKAPGSFFPVGTTVVKATAVDVCGNATSCTFEVTVKDVDAPVARTRNVDVYLDADGKASVTVADINNGSSDNCGIASLDLSKENFNCSNVGANQIMLTVTDIHDNVSTAMATVTVHDNIAPTALAQDVDIYLNAAGSASTTAADVNNGSYDNCSIASLVLSKTDFTCTNVGENEVTLTVTDGNGNVSASTATVTVHDDIAPTAIGHNVDVYLDAAGSASATAEAVNNGSSDNCGIASMVLSKTSFDCSNVGSNAVVLTVTDVNGNVSTVNAAVIVHDDLAPIVSTHDLIIGLDSNGHASITPLQVNDESTDNCNIVSYSLDKTTFDCSNVGDNTVVLKVADVNGNFASQTARVTVRDEIAPVVVTQNITVKLDSNGAASINAAQVNNGSGDNCSIASMSVMPNAFTCTNVGSNTVTLTVMDVNGNVSAAVATVFVEDKIAPVIITQNIIANLNATGSVVITPAQINNGSRDNCSIASLSLSKTTFNCTNMGPNTVVLTVTDVNGNVSTAIATVMVKDTIKPTVRVQNKTIQLSTTGTVSITAVQIDNGSTDNCAIASVTVTPASFTCANVGTNTVTLTVTDVNGNVATATAIVTVQDNIAPVVKTKNISVTLAGGTVSILGEDVNNGSTDNCSIAEYSVTPNTFTCSNIGANTVTLKVTDVNGNSSTKTASVNVIGAIPTATISQGVQPVFTQGGAVVLTATSPNGITFDWTGGPSDPEYRIYNSGTYTVKVTNQYGCFINKSTSVVYTANNLLSSYVIIAEDDVELDDHVTVYNGGVGSISSCGDVEVKDYSTITAPGTFVRAKNIDVRQNSYVTTKVFTAVPSTILPTFLYNPYCNGNNNTCNHSHHNSCSHGRSGYYGCNNYDYNSYSCSHSHHNSCSNNSNSSNNNKNVNQNAIVVITDSIMGTVVIGKNATVTFTAANLYLKDLEIKEGATVIFTQCGSMRVCNHVKVDKGALVNATNPVIMTIYVEKKFDVDEGARVTANVYSKDKVTIDGKSTASTTMTGLFIGESVDAKEYVKFYWNTASVCSNSAYTKTIIEAKEDGLIDDYFEASVYPNPAISSFNIRLFSSSATPFTIEVYDMNGRLMEHKEVSHSTLHEEMGEEYADGVYFVRVTQGDNNQTLKLIKANR